MSSSTAPKSTRDKVRQHRERLRAQALRPVRLWVPDMRLATFRAEARGQAELLAASAHATVDQAFVDAVSEWPER